MNQFQIKNRTSTVPPERTAGRIEEMLAKAGATDIRKRYDAGELRGLDFVIPTEFGTLSFRMPVDTDAAYRVLYNQRRRVASMKALRDQAKRTAWKLAQEWLEIQLALVAMRQAELVQVLLPYAVTRDDRPMFEAFKEQRFAALLPPAPSDRPAGEVIDGEIS